jgi:glycosyltransferase involved in cell wall biosynthesis
MRVVVCIIDDLGRGGAQRQLVELARGIDRRRFDLRVIALSTEKVTYRAMLEALNVPVVLIPHHGTLSWLTLMRVRGLLCRWRPSLVQTWLFTADFYGRIAARWAGVPSVISTVRSPEPDKPRHYVLADRWLGRWTDLVVVNAACTAEVLVARERLPREKLRVVYNGIDLEAFDPARANGSARLSLGLESSAVVIGSVGRLEPVKRYGDLVVAVARIAGRFPKARLCLVGEGSRREALLEQAQQLGVGDRLVLPGVVGVGQIAAALAAMDCFVLPSEYEGCSNAILEAMALGRPVIATDVGGNRELLGHETRDTRHETQGGRRKAVSSEQKVSVRDMGQQSHVSCPLSHVDLYEVVECGILVRRGDVDGLAAALAALLADPVLARRLGERARARVEERFATARMVQEMSAVYDEVLADVRP